MLAFSGASLGTAWLPSSPMVTRALWLRRAVTMSPGVSAMAVSLAGSGQMRIAASAPNDCTLPTPSTRRSACSTLDAASSPSCMSSRLPSDFSDTTNWMLSAAFSTRTPSRRTDSGRRGSTALSRFCTSTAAMSGLVPCLKVRLMLAQPVESLLDEVYIRPGAPFISRSMMAVTASSTTLAEAPA